MNNVVAVTAAGAAAVVFNRWLHERRVPVVSDIAGLSNRVVGTAAGVGLGIVGTAGETAGAVVVAAGGAVRSLGRQIERLAVPGTDRTADEPR